MKKRFVVIIENSTKEQNDSFLEWIRGEKVGWWHWFQNVWLLSNVGGDLTSKGVRDKVREFFPGANTLVLELRENEGTWSGFGPVGGKRNMFAWLKKSWRKD